jgi:hypothetical protein
MFEIYQKPKRFSNKFFVVDDLIARFMEARTEQNRAVVGSAFSPS